MFQLGEEYERPQLLAFVGSKQQQSGIIWGPIEPNCVIITSGGRHGKKVGYGDDQNPDGSWNYIGQGSKGDQSSTIKSNAMLSSGTKEILLFSTREPGAGEVRTRGSYKKLYKFEGIFKVATWDFYKAMAGPRTGDKLIQFHLVRAHSVYDFQPDEHIKGSKVDATHSSSSGQERQSIMSLREKLSKGSEVLPIGKISVREYKRRSKLIHNYALLRANGICENCLAPAPFTTQENFPFLEVHHIHTLSDDGPDTAINVAALCPNCHREAHFGLNRITIKDTLILRIASKEKELAH